MSSQTSSEGIEVLRGSSSARTVGADATADSKEHRQRTGMAYPERSRDKHGPKLIDRVGQLTSWLFRDSSPDFPSENS